MPCAIVGDIQTGHAGLLTHVKNDRLNQLFHGQNMSYREGQASGKTYLNSARMTQSWYPHTGFRPSPMLSACACKSSLSSWASPYILSSGTASNASSNKPGFSYFVGINDRVINRFRNFCDCASVGGVGTLGILLSDEYDGGVALIEEPLDVEGR